MDDQEPTKIPVVDASDPTPPVVAAPAVVDAPSSDAQSSVPGTPDSPPVTGEQVAPLPEPSPNPSPATAAPATDAVSINTHLQTASGRLQEVIDYVKNNLPSVDLSDVVSDIENVIANITSKVI